MAGYGTDAAFDAWLDDNGYTLTSGIDETVLRQRGSAYVDGLYGYRFAGRPAGGVSQDRAWPRCGVCIYGAEIADDVIPAAVEQASYAAAYQEDQSPGSLSVAATASGAVQSEEVAGVIKTSYFEGTGDVAKDSTPVLSVVEGLLRPFIGSNIPALSGTALRSS